MPARASTSGLTWWLAGKRRRLRTKDVVPSLCWTVLGIDQHPEENDHELTRHVAQVVHKGPRRPRRHVHRSEGADRGGQGGAAS